MLGLILVPSPEGSPWPSEIAYSGASSSSFLCPHDPGFNTRGEPWFYNDTQLGQLMAMTPRQRKKLRKQAKLMGLGDIPTDWELAQSYSWYTPVASGTVAAKEGWWTPTWVPPDGWTPAGRYGPPVALSGPNLAASDVTIPSGASTSEAQSIVNALNAQNSRVFKLTLVSTAVIALAALMNTYRAYKQAQRDDALLKRHLSPA